MPRAWSRSGESTCWRLVHPKANRAGMQHACVEAHGEDTRVDNVTGKRTTARLCTDQTWWQEAHVARVSERLEAHECTALRLQQHAWMCSSQAQAPELPPVHLHAPCWTWHMHTPPGKPTTRSTSNSRMVRAWTENMGEDGGEHRKKVTATQPRVAVCAEARVLGVSMARTVAGPHETRG